MDNIEKNTYVKKQITTALLTLIKDRDLKDISVREITETAQVSRNSFYRNYSEKEEILIQYIGDLFGQWTSVYDQSPQQSNDDMLGHMFGHFSEYREFYLLLCERNLLYLIKNVLKGVIGPKSEYANYEAYLTAFIYSGIFGWIEEWFSRGMQESAEEMTELLKKRGLA